MKVCVEIKKLASERMRRLSGDILKVYTDCRWLSWLDQREMSEIKKLIYVYRAASSIRSC